ncbi:MsrA Peptide methionine sulfoxide reductase [Burkholderiales bacterium]
MQTIYLGGGCFWCIEAVFQRIRGVVALTSGYMGGQVPHPSYEQVCGKQTGHAEVVRVEFDDQSLSLSDLFAVFFEVHDPTSLNRQGDDVGPQYRSAIFATTDEQLEAARSAMDHWRQTHEGSDSIVTELHRVSPEQAAGTTQEVDKTFFPAEAYHQNYFNQHPHQGYCAVVVASKVAKSERAFVRLQVKAPGDQ